MDTDLAVPMPKRELYFVFGALMLGMLLAALDSTIVATALPTIVGDLHGASHLSWVGRRVPSLLDGQHSALGQVG